ncbi:MAG: RNA polymerase factor sigma-54 [Alphaproteobacteria bacterium]
MRQSLRQGQQLVMTQQLQQAIKLLQLSTLDLAAYIEREVQNNPLLEIDDQYGDTDGQPLPETETNRRDLSSTDRVFEGSVPIDSEGASGAERDNVFTHDDAPDQRPAVNDDRWLESGGQWGSSSAGGEGGTFLDVADRAVEELPSLRDTLHEQLALSVADTEQQMIGRYLIDTLDDSGYLTDDLAEVAERLGCTVAEIESLLPLLQDFDPPGVFARSLSECLALQLQQIDRFDPAMRALVENLDILADGQLATLQRRCGVGDEDFADMLQELRALDPKPGLAFDGGAAEPVVPDVFVWQRDDGSWAIELNSDVLPKVLLNRRYYAEVKGASRSKTDKAYLSECFGNASWLIKALDQRAQTILKVASELVQQQEGFFLNGVRQLKPLTLRQVADEIGMHESTVSRVTASKYLTCPRGTFELKYFFNSAINATEGGDAHSAEAVRQRIKKLVDSEDPASILSDDKIVNMLKEEDIDIARRTVAKYREALHIPSSVQRRRLKAARAS